MCKKLCAVASLLVILSMSAALYADNCMTETEERVGWAGEKFVRGATNLASGWLEFFAKIDKNVTEKESVEGAVNGVAEGLVWSGYRTAAGACDLVLSPFAAIKQDEKPIIDPPTLFEK
ncbi:exosortase system-associated protein, TIGR04073 family [bacterium]|nr:exosortase system-associated protein, TIGR04073 family [bacterium]